MNEKIKELIKEKYNTQLEEMEVRQIKNNCNIVITPDEVYITSGKEVITVNSLIAEWEEMKNNYIYCPNSYGCPHW